MKTVFQLCLVLIGLVLALQAEAAQDAFAELITIYHAEHADPAVRPPLP